MAPVLRQVGRFELIEEVGRGGMARRLPGAPDRPRPQCRGQGAARVPCDGRDVRGALPARVAHRRLAAAPEHRHGLRLLRVRRRAVHRDGVRRARLAAPADVGNADAGRRSPACSRACSPAWPHARARGIVHRDIKPENLMVTADGTRQDRRLRHRQGAQPGRATSGFATRTGTTVGTPAYMAPEQAMAKDIGPWTDLYSAGVIGYELLTRQGAVLRHRRRRSSMLMRQVNDPPPPPQSLNPSLDPAVSRVARADAGEEAGRPVRRRDRGLGGVRGDRHRRARPALAPRGAAPGARPRARHPEAADARAVREHLRRHPAEPARGCDAARRGRPGSSPSTRATRRRPSHRRRPASRRRRRRPR